MVGRWISIAVAVAGLVAASGGIAPVQAADQTVARAARTSTIVLSTDVPSPRTFGYATARLTITWKSPRKAVVRGSLDDKCPGDGAGATLQIFGSSGPGTRFDDTRSCSARSKSFRHTVTAPRGRKVRFVRLILQEIDQSKNLAYDGASARPSNPLA